MLRKFLEFKKSGFEPVKSFYLQDELNPKIWTNFEIDEDIRDELLQISNDYIDSLEIESLEIEDIILSGSLANYNWSSYSDFDLHILSDFSKVTEDKVIVKKLYDSSGRLWNQQHNILISGYEVEIYMQDIEEEHISSGQYSLLNNKWIIKPSKENFEPDEDLIKMKGGRIMDTIDEIEADSKEQYSYEDLSERISKIWKKIKDNRKKGLDDEGEFSIENLVFKLLRRNGYIKKIIELKSYVYDNQFK